MKKYPLFALPLGLAAFAGACLIGVLSGVVILMHSFVPTARMPFFYFEHLNLPVLSVALPAIGMLALAPIALRMAFARETVAETSADTLAKPQAETVEHILEERYLKTA